MFEEELANLPVNPPRSPDLLPGLRIRSAVSGANLFFMFSLVLIFGLVSATILLADPHERLALGPTKTISASVTSVTLAGCHGSGRVINYAFVPTGTIRYIGSLTTCSGSPFYKLERGDDIPVKYLASDPSINAVIGSAETNKPPDFGLFMFPLFTLIALVALASPLRQIFRARRIFRRGTITKGSIVFVKRRVNSAMARWPSMMPTNVYIKYQLPSGASTEGQVSCTNDWLLAHLAPGTAVNIAIDPRKPGDIVLLDAYIR